MPKIRCPENCKDGYHFSSGDGWEEWDECRCCNPKGHNDTGMVSEARLAKFRREEAAAEKRAEQQVREYEREMGQPCPKCGLAKGKHANRDGEPCKTFEEANREYEAERAAQIASKKADLIVTGGSADG